MRNRATGSCCIFPTRLDCYRKRCCTKLEPLGRVQHPAELQVLSSPALTCYTLRSVQIHPHSFALAY